MSSYWINSEADYTTSRTTGQQLFGNYSLRVKVNQTQSNGGGCYYQQVDGSKLTAGGTYTLSAYVKTNGLTRANSAALGQLTRENNRYLNATVVYAYDGGGNLTSRTIYPYTTGELGEATDTITYTYDSQWKDLLTGYDGQSITSDEIGNPLTYRDGMNMSWDGRQLTQLTKDGTTIIYQYGSDGLRTSKTVNGEEHRYWYQDGQLVYEERGDSKQFYYSYDGYGHLSCIRYYHNGTGYVYYVQTNSRGDVEALYLGDGSLRVRYLYDSWGNTISIQNGNGQEITSPNDIGNLNPFRYRGYYLDSETGLYYISSRYYDPEICRWINADGELSEVGGNIRGYNLFAYCFNNPVNMDDSTGKWPKWLSGALNVIGGALQVVAGATLGATVGWTGFGAVAAGFLIVNGTATVAQGVGQIVNHVTKSHVMREDNIVRTGVQEVGRAIGGDTGAKIAGGTYDVAVIAANLYAGKIGLQQAGLAPIKVNINNVVNNPLDEFVTIGPADGVIAQYCRTIPQSGYGKIYVTQLGNGLYQIANGHHRVAALRALGYETIKIFLTK